MDMHAADDHASADSLQILRNGVVALLVRVPLRAPCCEGMRRRCDWRQAITARDDGDRIAKMRQVRAGSGHARAYLGRDLDLRPLVLSDETVAQLGGALVQHLLRGLAHKSARGEADEEVFLLNPERE